MLQVFDELLYSIFALVGRLHAFCYGIMASIVNKFGLASRIAPAAEWQAFTTAMQCGLRHRQLRSEQEDLPYHEDLIPLGSPKGVEMLDKATKQGTARRELVNCQVRQSHPAFCGLAAVATVMRAASVFDDRKFIAWSEHGGPEWAVTAPMQKNFPPDFFRHFGFSFLDRYPAMIKFQLFKQVLQYDGVPLAAIPIFFGYQGWPCKVMGPPTSQNILEKDILPMIYTEQEGKRTFVVANYGRPIMRQRGSGHFAPLAAVVDDHVLVVEVNNWRYPSVWVPMGLMFDAVSALTPQGKPRGLCIVEQEIGKPASSTY